MRTIPRRCSLAVAFGSLLLCALCVPPTALAVWPDDPAINLAVADGPGEQVLPKIAGLPDGSCYVGWFSNASGNYDVWLQRLDQNGNEMWPHNGILVSSHPQESWITDWDLLCDSSGNCVLAFNDSRTGNWDVQAYMIDPNGVFVWGPDGITLSHDPAPDMMPAICETSDGDFVFAWATNPDVGTGWMTMQRLGPDGTLRLPDGGLVVIHVANETPAFADLVPSDGGDALLMWVRDISAYMSPRHIRLQRFDAHGSAVWTSFVAIFDGGAVPLGYAPEILSDAAGGAVCGWHYSPSTSIVSLAQRVTAAGTEVFPHNGVLVSTNTSRMHVDPATAYSADTGEIFVFWNERNSTQDERGIYGQRLSALGARMWGNDGLVLQAVSTEYKGYPRAVPLGDGAVCFYTDTPAGFTGDRLVAHRLDATGANVWAAVPTLVSTAQSGKSRLPLFIDGAGTTRIAWEDTRNGAPDVYAQSLDEHGALGVDPTAVAEPRLIARGSSYPNPFRGSTSIQLETAAGGAARLVIAGLDGRVVRDVDIILRAGGAAAWRWDGRDDAGREVPAGVYTYRWQTGAESHAQGKVVVVR